MTAPAPRSNRMLWILDQQPSPIDTWLARLARLNHRLLSHEIVWQGPRSWLFDEHWLTVDRDGQVLLTSSSSYNDTSVVVKFRATPFSMGTAEPVLMQTFIGKLLGPPVVDSNGYLFLFPSMLMQQIIQGGGQGRISSIRVPELQNHAANGINLADCM